MSRRSRSATKTAKDVVPEDLTMTSSSLPLTLPEGRLEGCGQTGGPGQRDQKTGDGNTEEEEEAATAYDSMFPPSFMIRPNLWRSNTAKHAPAYDTAR